MEESPCCRGVTALGQHDIDDLAELIDGPVEVLPDPDNLQVGLVHEPAVTGGMPARAGGVDELAGEPLHPPVERHMVDLDAPLGQQLLEVAIRQHRREGTSGRPA